MINKLFMSLFVIYVNVFTKIEFYFNHIVKYINAHIMNKLLKNENKNWELIDLYGNVLYKTNLFLGGLGSNAASQKDVVLVLYNKPNAMSLEKSHDTMNKIILDYNKIDPYNGNYTFENKGLMDYIDDIKPIKKNPFISFKINGHLVHLSNSLNKYNFLLHNNKISMTFFLYYYKNYIITDNIFTYLYYNYFNKKYVPNDFNVHIITNKMTILNTDLKKNNIVLSENSYTLETLEPSL